MSRKISDDEFLSRIAAQSEFAQTAQAPSRLKARIYSGLLRQQTETGPLLSLEQTKADGKGLCVFEELVRIAPVGEAAKCLNFCRVCHARALAETFEQPPVYWPNCPYVSFKKS
ncbi:MAG: hypothetical protein WBX38_11675 [Candidatus Sulfotelmatobacter sp.]